MMRKLTLSIGAVLLATAGVAVAAPQMGGQARPDITRAEVQAKAAERFAKLDANNDGKLDQADRAARRAKAFDRIDADHNGAISRDEFTAMHPQGGRGQRGGMAGMDHGAMAAGGHRMGGDRMGGRRMGPMGRMMMAKMADTNNDGAISQAEFTAAALKHFDAADADHNGTVTQAERASARAAMKAKWQAAREARQAN